MEIIGKIVRYVEGSMTPEDMVEFYQEVKNSMANTRAIQGLVDMHYYYTKGREGENEI